MTPSLTTAAWLAVPLALVAASASTVLDEGQGPATDDATSAELSPGKHLLGPAFKSSEALGRVVVVEIGGS